MLAKCGPWVYKVEAFSGSANLSMAMRESGLRGVAMDVPRLYMSMKFPDF